jgi:uncharacterized protein HemX
MNKNTPPKKKKLKDKLSFKPKYLVIFFMICVAFLVILAAVVRATQQRLIKTSRENTQQIQTMSLKLQRLQQQQTQYDRWWQHERSNNTQNNLYDVLYKIKLANVYFSLGENVRALQLLKSTQSILNTLNNKQTDSLKQQITDTVEYLNTLTQVNINKTIVTLDQAIETIETLPVLNGYSQQQNTQIMPPQTSEQSPSTLQSHWWDPILKQLKQLVVIHRTKTDEGIFFKENALLIKQMIIQKILQAQQALLRNDFVLYQHNTNVAMTWLKEYCSKDKKQLQTIITTLTNLNAYKINSKNRSIDFYTLIDTTEKIIDQLSINTTAESTQSEPLKQTAHSSKVSLSPLIKTLSSKSAIEI